MTAELWAQLVGGIGFFILVSGTLWGIWWRIEGKVDKAKAEVSTVASSASALASLARQELAEHRLHVAETYITKQGMRETTEQIMEAIHGVKTAVDHMTLRVDRIVENQAKPRTTRAG
ncbi:hypothetical protein [Shinella sp. DD12]|uniref:hypothetical protein n=1 Tax=Shinella sp. DD12 TaxID=1410620 RepID=UPI000437C40B|nr:hypothetical protein [Shinella sp. DD12]EYR81898.1 hypothetical protein SHLA_4c001900 [Shinella sp. DD12]